MATEAVMERNMKECGEAGEGKTILITGVSKGLGRALALELAKRGHTVIGCFRDQTKLDSLLHDLFNASPSPLNHLLLNVDVVSPYCSSKWAIEGLTKSIAKELPDGMAIVALDPGIIYTDMLVSCFGNLASQYQLPQEWYIVGLNGQGKGSSVF